MSPSPTGPGAIPPPGTVYSSDVRDLMVSYQLLGMGKDVSLHFWEDRPQGDRDYNDIVLRSTATNDTIAPAPVPIPPALAAGLTGLAALAVSTRRRRRH